MGDRETGACVMNGIDWEKFSDGFAICMSLLRR